MLLEPIEDYTEIIHFFFKTILIVVILFILFISYIATGIYYLIEYYSEINFCVEKDIWYYILLSLIIQCYFFISLTIFYQLKYINNIISVNIILSTLGIVFGIFELLKNESQCIDLHAMNLWKYGFGVFIMYFIYFLLHTTLLYNHID